MTRNQLEHAIRAACDVSEDTELWIFGSQAILGEFPNAHENLRASIEVDVQPKNRPEAVDYVDGALGELSQFHQTHGFYVHGGYPLNLRNFQMVGNREPYRSVTLYRLVVKQDCVLSHTILRPASLLLTGTKTRSLFVCYSLRK